MYGTFVRDTGRTLFERPQRIFTEIAPSCVKLSFVCGTRNHTNNTRTVARYWIDQAASGKLLKCTSEKRQPTNIYSTPSKQMELSADDVIDTTTLTTLAVLCVCIEWLSTVEC